MKTYAKFAALIVVVIGALGWMASIGISEAKTYYKTVAELEQMDSVAKSNKLRVGGDVEEHSIVRSGREVRFILKQDAKRLPVVYSGIDPLPDTFRDGAQALADGRLGHDGVFQATKIQAKCASKYEAKPTQKDMAPVKRGA